jgi:CRP-like cAMP-binding protein
MSEHLVRKLQLLSPLTDSQALAIQSMFTGSRRVPGGEDVICEGDRPPSISLMLEGLACRYKTLPDGRRQIMGFLIAGDLIDVYGYMIGDMDHSVGALTACRVAVAPNQKVSEALDQHGGLAVALWAETVAEGAVAREWLVGLGRRSAYSRIAHLLCEVTARLQSVGQADGAICDLPLTQQELADSLGLSLVHVNRVLQRLRASGLISLGRGFLRVHDLQGLQHAGEFDPSYLRLSSNRRQSKSTAPDGNYIRP